MYKSKYDELSPEDIERFGKRLDGKSLTEVIGSKPIPTRKLESVISSRTKGRIGNLVEKYYFGISPGNESRPDFEKASVELKVTPAKKNVNGSYSAKERLVLGMIDYISEARVNFIDSSYYKKNAQLMVMWYLNESKAIGKLKFLVSRLYKFQNLPDEDKKIIKEDWEVINSKLKSGLAHTLSEGDTFYLSACTKSSSSKIRRPQVGEIPAKPRAYSYKQSYMTQLLRRELNAEIGERIIKTNQVDESKKFEEQVIDKFQPFIGKSISDIRQITKTTRSSGKGKYARLARAMLGISNKKISEFQSAGVIMKTIQVKHNGTPKESMSFPSFKYKDIIEEVWDGDEENGEKQASFQKIIESRFLLVIYKCKFDCKGGDEKFLHKVMFWNMPYEDRLMVEKVWQDTIKKIKEGDYDNFVSISDDKVAHVRPHAKNASDTNLTPQGEQRIKLSFWLNSKYLKEIIS